jgi:hypothetical protein
MTWHPAVTLEASLSSRRITGMARLAAVMVALFIAAGCAGGSHHASSNAQLGAPFFPSWANAAFRRHYFLVGKRECARGFRIGVHSRLPVPKGAVWVGPTIVNVSYVPKGVPSMYRRAAVAGCEAAARRLI